MSAVPRADVSALPSHVAVELGRASGAARRRRSEAVRRLVYVTREAQGLPPTVTDIEVLERVAELIAGGPQPDKAA